jgi:hypothetical protein
MQLEMGESLFLNALRIWDVNQGTKEQSQVFDQQTRVHAGKQRQTQQWNATIQNGAIQCQHWLLQIHAQLLCLLQQVARTVYPQEHLGNEDEPLSHPEDG